LNVKALKLIVNTGNQLRDDVIRQGLTAEDRVSEDKVPEAEKMVAGFSDSVRTATEFFDISGSTRDALISSRPSPPAENDVGGASRLRAERKYCIPQKEKSMITTKTGIPI